jgi:hypothetical protein
MDFLVLCFCEGPVGCKISMLERTGRHATGTYRCGLSLVQFFFQDAKKLLHRCVARPAGDDVAAAKCARRGAGRRHDDGNETLGADIADLLHRVGAGGAIDGCQIIGRIEIGSVHARHESGAIGGLDDRRCMRAIGISAERNGDHGAVKTAQIDRAAGEGAVSTRRRKKTRRHQCVAKKVANSH